MRCGQDSAVEARVAAVAEIVVAEMAGVVEADGNDNIAKNKGVSKMKKASTLISVIIAIVVLLAALGVGFSVKQFRVRRAEKVAEAEPAPKAKKPVGRAALPGRGERSRSSGPTAEQRAERQAERERENERVANMSEAERREYFRERSERFGGADRRGEGGGRRRGGMGMSEEERRAMRERYENMSEEERQQAREEMRQRLGSRRRGDRRGMPGGGSDGDRRRGDGEGMSEGSSERPTEN